MYSVFTKAFGSLPTLNDAKSRLPQCTKLHRAELEPSLGPGKRALIEIEPP